MEILYEDNHLIIVNKTCHDLVQGDKTGDVTLPDQIKEYLKEKYDKPGNVFLGVTHRLDRPTSGVVVFAKTSKALERMNALFANHGVKKTYWAIVEGCPEKSSDRLCDYLSRVERLNKSFISTPDDKKAKQAILTYTTLAKGERYTLLSINLETGRHHQIRAQLAHLGHCVKGDLKYGAKRPNPDKGICLHARSVHFRHPVSGLDINVTAPVPHDSLWTALSAHVV